MVHYSVVIPQRDREAELERQLVRLRDVLDRLALPYELLCVDDGSGPQTQQQLARLAAEYTNMRVLRLDKPAGASVALSAGLVAAQGDILIAVEPGDRYSVEQIPHLVARLSRLDLVFGRRRLGGWKKFWHRVGRIPRGLLLGLEVRQPDCLFWAARREAVQGIRLAPGMRRYLPWLVARRGFRVGDIYVDEVSDARPVPDARPNPLDLLAAWWTCRRWRDDSAREIDRFAAAVAEPALKIARVDTAPDSSGPQAVLAPIAPHRSIRSEAKQA